MVNEGYLVCPKPAAEEKYVVRVERVEKVAVDAVFKVKINLVLPYHLALHQASNWLLFWLPVCSPSPILNSSPPGERRVHQVYDPLARPALPHAPERSIDQGVILYSKHVQPYMPLSRARLDDER